VIQRIWRHLSAQGTWPKINIGCPDWMLRGLEGAWGHAPNNLFMIWVSKFLEDM